MTTLLTSDIAFSEFYREFFRDLTAFLMMNGAKLADAAEVAQDTMLKAYLSWSTIDHPKAWAQKVAFRAWKRRNVLNREDPVEDVADLGALLPPSVNVEDWINRYDLLTALDRLPQRQHEVIAWTRVGYSSTEIATELGITADAVRASLMKARRSLAEYLGAPR